MKKFLLVIFCAALAFNFSACAEKGPQPSDSLYNIVKTAAEENSLTKGKLYTSESAEPGEYLDADLISGIYGSVLSSPDFSLIEEYAVYIDDTNTLLRMERGIFKTFNEDDTEMVTEFLTTRKESIVEMAKNYPSSDITPHENFILEVKGSYVYFIAVKENRNGVNDYFKEKLGF